MSGTWVPHDTRDAIVDFISNWVERAGLPAYRLPNWVGLSTSKYGTWQQRYGKVNEHNGMIPRDFWLEQWEQHRIVEYAKANSGEGNRRLSFMMLDDDVVAVSPSSVYRVPAGSVPGCQSIRCRVPCVDGKLKVYPKWL